MYKSILMLPGHELDRPNAIGSETLVSYQTDHIIWSIWYDLTQGKPLMRGFYNVNSSNISFICNRLTLRDLTMRLKSNLRQQ